MDLETFGVVAVVAFFAAYLGTIVVALLQISRVPNLRPWSRAAWILVIVAMPLLGAFAWFAIGSRTPEAERAVSRLLR
ncbi:PLDc N-terminal domain-containing protein [Clavibacter michiganensis]|uniref:PLDc N-terminal domain-containing protein n=1 Tax=Clavibacter michiganensis TaxID=28447 RepID=UPI000B394997|nr:PLDc N-terminal domain-containing protein [Clavibacter michiganensis]MDO4033046.1 PLDc N-terminal domain-containing protein [Clavibacter michiganensis]MDO4081749.1 PLDc N-terminal domain-containing protein [Clavibacter michiganensis]MDO4086744.1 PLDc N-terminal domain-containing protein [Clavibacter michiganensis]MDO4097870.1 PLDc N-terminal domain-containing protein [Clavibacter michiganensis]MWJ04797.1 hypothetical protein [Clavibacter michiganensis subsp. michiganensis]